MIRVQKVRIKPSKGTDGWFPHPLTHNTRQVCTEDPETKLPIHSLCPTREWEREWFGHHSQHFCRARGDSFSFWGNASPYWGG